MKTKLLLIFTCLALVGQHYIAPKIGISMSRIDNNIAKAVKLPFMGVDYQFKANSFVSISSGIEARGIGYIEGSESLLSAYASVPVYGTFDLGKGKKVIALDAGLVGNINVFSQGIAPKSFFEWMAGGRIGYESEKRGVCLFYRFSNPLGKFNGEVLNSNVLGVQANWRLK